MGLTAKQAHDIVASGEVSWDDLYAHLKTIRKADCAKHSALMSRMPLKVLLTKYRAYAKSRQGQPIKGSAEHLTAVNIIRQWSEPYELTRQC